MLLLYGNFLRIRELYDLSKTIVYWLRIWETSKWTFRIYSLQPTKF